MSEGIRMLAYRCARAMALRRRQRAALRDGDARAAMELARREVEVMRGDVQ